MKDTTRFRCCTPNDSSQTLYSALGTKSFNRWDYTEAPVEQDWYMILNSINCFVNEIRGQVAQWLKDPSVKVSKRFFGISLFPLAWDYSLFQITNENYSCLSQPSYFTEYEKNACRAWGDGFSKVQRAACYVACPEGLWEKPSSYFHFWTNNRMQTLQPIQQGQLPMHWFQAYPTHAYCR